jgi:hypothetical protein
MNALEAKAIELADMAKAHGLDPKMDVRGDWLVYLDYTHNFYSIITYTETGKVRVESFDVHGGCRKEKISHKNLDECLQWAGERKKRADEIQAKKEADKFISDHFKITTVGF